jgi:hypothetical protein
MEKSDNVNRAFPLAQHRMRDRIGFDIRIHNDKEHDAL